MFLSARVVGTIGLLAVELILSPLTFAQITQTPGAESLNTQVNKVGNIYEITQGTPVGANIFHSFGEFSISSVETAQFQTSNMAPDITVGNVLGRVTGGTPSTIFGTVDSLTFYPNANLFLMNPSGIIFGPNATLNVGGSVAFTTANYIRLFDGVNSAIFYADPASDAVTAAGHTSILSSAPLVDFGFVTPAAFGFLNSTPATITVQGSNLFVPTGRSISLVSGNQGVTYTDPDTLSQADVSGGVTMVGGRLHAPGGETQIATVASAGEISHQDLGSGPNINGDAFTGMGQISLSQGATIDVSDSAAGTIRIRGGQFELINSILNADTGNSNGAETAIDIHLTGNLSISSDSVSALTARSFGDGNAGEIYATSTKMETVSTLPDDTALIDSHTEGAGNGGNITLKTGELTVMGNPGGFDFFIMSGTSGTGNGGNVVVNAETSHLQTARIDTGDAILGGEGSGGHVTYTGGDMTFDFVSIVTDSLNARGGNLLFDGRDITITNGSSIGPLSLLGESTLTIYARDFALRDVSILFNQTALGAGGGTTLTVQNAEFTNGSRVFSQTNGDADAGFIRLFATGDVTFADTFGTFNPIRPFSEQTASGLFTNSLGDVNLGTFGDAGPIDVVAHSLTMTGGARFNSTTRTDGNSGNMTLTASQSVTMLNNASISASSTGPGNAGNISIDAGKQFVMRNSSVTTKSEQAGGGNIEINATEQIRLVESQVNASAFLDGGNITFDPILMILQNSQILAQAIQGAGGNITITTPLFLADQTSLVSASSQFGLNGTVTIQSPTSNLSGSLGTLTSKTSQTQILLTQRCAALTNGQASSFVVAGREQLPSDPGGWLTSPIALAEIDADPFRDGTVAESASNVVPRTSGLLANTTVSLRRLTPSGFLTANFADSEATGCHS
jgi:filamentous hemagglutinin family protein